MPTLPDFRLETYFAKWEFSARYHLTASDAQTLAVSELLALADDDGRARWESLALGYTETRGLPALRSAIAETYGAASADDVLCFAGAEEAIYLAMRTLLEPTDHLVVLTPNYQAAETIPLAVCGVTGVALRPEDGWALDVDAVERALRPNTRMVSVNFPNNPTGAVPSVETWLRLVQLCEDRGITLFSDEVYRGLVRAREHLLDRNRRIVAENLPVFTEFFARYPDLFEFTAPDGGCVCFPRYLGADGVETMCSELVEQAGVLLLPSSIYSSALTSVPADRFRIGLGRRDPSEALAAWADWLEKRG
jgi:aspartate/methionine/tyrosine aminotransferase